MRRMDSRYHAVTRMWLRLWSGYGNLGWLTNQDSQTSTRERLIDSATELFTLQGYERTGLAQVAQHADCLTGSLFHFFRTKESLLRATLERRLEIFQPEVLEPIWRRFEDPLERVFGLLDGYRYRLLATDFAHGCPIGNLVLETAETLPNTRSLLVANFESWLEPVEDCFRRAADRLPPDADPRRLALFSLATMEGAVMLARAWRDITPYDAAVSSLRESVERLTAGARSKR